MILSNDISVKRDKRNKSDKSNKSDKYDNNDKSVLMWRSSG
jgi:hypothetical protein